MNVRSRNSVRRTRMVVTAALAVSCIWFVRNALAFNVPSAGETRATANAAGAHMRSVIQVRDTSFDRMTTASTAISPGIPATSAATPSAIALPHERPLADVVHVSNAYALPALKGGTGGAFMQITNSGAVAVRIVRATSADANVVELHESMQHNGSTHMQQLAALDIAAGASVALKAGDKHFMLVGLRRAFAKGDTIRLVLAVENIGAKLGTRTRDLPVPVPVRIP